LAQGRPEVSAAWPIRDRPGIEIMLLVVTNFSPTIGLKPMEAGEGDWVQSGLAR